MLQDGSEGSSPKREQSAAIDIPTPHNKNSIQDPLRTRSDTQESNKSTNSTPKDTPKDVPSKSDEGTPPCPLSVSDPAIFERRYSEPVDMIVAGAVGRGGGPEQPESRGEEREGKERITWSKSAQQLQVTSPNSSVAIQIEVG